MGKRIFRFGDCDVTEECSECGKFKLIYTAERGFQNTYLDWEKVENWGDVNAVYGYE